MTGDTVKRNDIDGIAVLSLSRPPTNAFDDVMRAALYDCLSGADTDETVEAVVVHGRGADFCSGERLPDRDAKEASPTLAELCLKAETLSKPVVAVLHGAVMEGGLEFALACHFRVALQTAQLAFPLSHLGVPTRSGATQRLPRLIGAGAALSLLLTGRVARPADDEFEGLFDYEAPPNAGAAETGLAFAEAVVADAMSPVRTQETRMGFSDPDVYRHEIQAVRQAIAPERRPVLEEIVRCVEAAPLLPFDAGLRMEEDVHQRLAKAPATRARVNLFRAGQAARRVALPRGAAPISHVSLVRAGAQGAALALSLLNAGLRVSVIEPDEDRLDALEKRVRATLDQAMVSGRISAETRAERLMRLDGDVSAAAMGAAELVILFPRGVDDAARHLADLSGVVPRETIVAVMQRMGDPLALARRAGYAGRVLGLWLGQGQDGERLAEIVAAPGTDGAAASLVADLAARIGRVPVVGEGGSIGAKLDGAFFAAADDLIAAGHLPRRIDAVLRAHGWREGPCARQDRLSWSVVTASRAAAGSLAGSGELARRLAERGQAFGDVSEAEWDALCQDVEPLPTLTGTHEAEIVRHVVVTLTAAAVDLLEQGVARSAESIDLVAVHGLGSPAWYGGPLGEASGIGMMAVRRDLRALAQADGARWSIGPLLDALIREGRSFVPGV